MKRILHYFDKLEDRIRGRLSRFPILYSIIGGTGVVLFWRGVWTTADDIAKLLPEQFVWIDGPLSVVVSLSVLLATGLFVSFFVNDQIILSGVIQDKKIVEKTESEVRAEASMVDDIRKDVEHIQREVHDLHDDLALQHHAHS